MVHIGLFLGMSFGIMTLLILAQWRKNIGFKQTIGLFLFGVMVSIPFLMVEYISFLMKYYLVILAFIAIELAIIYFEHRIKFFHDLIHHNVKHLRIVSFLLIGMGFTFSELAFTIFHSHETAHELMTTLPLKAIYALLIHTVLSTASSLSALGVAARGLLETALQFISYYLRIVVISVAHYLYVFIAEHHQYALLIAPFLIINLVLFFRYKNYLDAKRVTI